MINIFVYLAAILWKRGEPKASRGTIPVGIFGKNSRDFSSTGKAKSKLQMFKIGVISNHRMKYTKEGLQAVGSK